MITHRTIAGALACFLIGTAQQPGIGTPVRDGQFEFVVQQVECGKDSVGPSELARTARGQFCLVTLAVKNVGDRAQRFVDSAQQGFDANGTEYGTDPVAGFYANGSTGPAWMTGIHPGNQVTGIIVFDLPDDAELVRLELHDSLFSDGVEVRLK
jgi:hypothetical protein